MLKKITYRKKFKLLWVMAGLLLIFCWRFSIAKTIDEYRNYNQNQNAATGNEFYNEQNLRSKSRMLDEVLEKFMLDTLDNSKNLVEVVSNLCEQNNVRLKEYKPNPVSEADSLRLLTRSVRIEGKFTDCLRLIYQLETRSRIGRVSSVLFKSSENADGSKTILNCTFYIQNIIP